MASDNHANYFRIGLVVALGVAATVGALVYLGGVRGGDEELLVETYSEKPVSGLSVGSPVNFRGVKVGEVRRISFIGTDYDVVGRDNQTIRIVMACKRSLMGLADHEDAAEVARCGVAAGARATVTASGITGLSRIELDVAPPDAPPPGPISWKPEYICFPPAPSLLDSFSDAATRIVNGIDGIDFGSFQRDLRDAMRSAASVASNASEVAEGVNDLLRDRRGDVDAILDDLRTVSGNLRDLTERLRDDPSLLLRPRSYDPLEETRR